MREILLVDDDVVFTDTFGTLLKREGYGVVTESTLPGAFRRLGAHAPDVLITATLLGSHNGWALVKHAKRSQPCLPVIVVTKMADMLEAEVEYFRVPVFLKPFDTQTMLAYLAGQIPVSGVSSHP